MLFLNLQSSIYLYFYKNLYVIDKLDELVKRKSRFFIKQVIENLKLRYTMKLVREIKSRYHRLVYHGLDGVLPFYRERSKLRQYDCFHYILISFFDAE